MCSLALQIPLLKTHLKIQLLIYQNTARRNCRSEKSFGLFCEVHRHVQKDHKNVKIIIKIKSLIGSKKQRFRPDSNPGPRDLQASTLPLDQRRTILAAILKHVLFCLEFFSNFQAKTKVVGSNPGRSFVFQVSKSLLLVI